MTHDRLNEGQRNIGENITPHTHSVYILYEKKPFIQYVRIQLVIRLVTHWPMVALNLQIFPGGYPRSWYYISISQNLGEGTHPMDHWVNGNFNAYVLNGHFQMVDAIFHRTSLTSLHLESWHVSSDVICPYMACLRYFDIN